jgi:hypothetical protein
MAGFLESFLDKGGLADNGSVTDSILFMGWIDHWLLIFCSTIAHIRT